MKATYFLLALLIILTSYGIQAGVQYTYPICFFKECRNMISTTYTGTTSSTSGKSLKVSYDNTKGKTMLQNTFTCSEPTTRSMSASPSVGANILSAEVRASLGGEASYSRTQTFSVQVNVPVGKIGRVYVSQRTDVAKFRHVIQLQQKETGEPDSKYKNIQGMNTEFSTVTTKTPVFSVETN